MDQHKLKQGRGSSHENTDSGFSEDAKEADNIYLQHRKSDLYVRSPSYDKSITVRREESHNDAQRRFMDQKENGNTLLHEAIIDKQENIAFEIIQVIASKETLQIKNCFGETPLVLSVEKGMLKVVALLIELEVDLNNINYQTLNNILHIAVSNNDEKMLTLLTSRMGNSEILASLANMVNEKGHTPLHLSVIKKNLDCCMLLLGAGSNIDAKAHQDGFTCLHFAVLTNDPEFVSIFIERCHPDLEIESYSGNTAYQLADINGFEAVKAVLSAAGALKKPRLIDDP